MATSAVAADDTARSSQWIDLCFGEPIDYASMVDELAEAAGVIFIGEFHTLDRHHAIQAKIVSDLAEQDVALVLGIEQMEADRQPCYYFDLWNSPKTTLPPGFNTRLASSMSLPFLSSGNS